MRQTMRTLLTVGAIALGTSAYAQAPALLPGSVTVQPTPVFTTSHVNFRAGTSPTPTPAPRPEAGERLLPINLATALQLANARPIDVQIAGRQVTLSMRQLHKANLLWVPNIVVGADYFRHDGGQQNFAGDVVRSSRNSTAVGFGPNVTFSAADALYAPLAARQDLRARMANRQAIENDVMLAVAEAYFHVQQARGELSGAMLAAAKAQEVATKAERLGEGLAPPLEANRARVELARRQQAVSTSRERWRLASADLVRLLRLEPGTLVDPVEPPFLSVTIIDSGVTLDSLVAIGLTTRPELAGQQAVVQATLTRLKQEKMRPLIPSLALRSVATNPGGSIGYGGFSGGPGSSNSSWGSRFDVDVQLLWEFSALGLGNRVRVGEKRVEHQMATLELFRTQDRIAAEVAQAFAQAKAAAERMAVAEPALREAVELTEKSLTGMGQTRRVGEINTLIVRPQEVVAAVQALGLANADFYSAVGDYNRAQFRLFRALGHPAQCLAGLGTSTEAATPAPAAHTPSIQPITVVSIKPTPIPYVAESLPGTAIPAIALQPLPIEIQQVSPHSHWPPVAREVWTAAINRPAASKEEQAGWRTSETVELPTIVRDPFPGIPTIPNALPPVKSEPLVPIAETLPVTSAKPTTTNDILPPTVIPPPATVTPPPMPPKPPEPTITWSKASDTKK